MSLLRDDLKKLLHERPDRVVFVVGTGVPLGAVRGAPCDTFASWDGLIRSGLERAHALGRLTAEELADHKKALGHQRQNALIHVASVVEETLGAPDDGEFRRWLRETVGTFEKNLRDRSVLDVLAEHQRRGALLATTNYDLLLEHATGLPAVTWRDPAGVDQTLRDPDEPQILHLHGAWRWPDSVVLGRQSYADVVRDQYAQTVLTALRTERTFVFVGCGAGLRDPNIGAFLKWSAEVFAGAMSRHFRLCRDSEADAVRAEHPDGQRIFPLPYGPNHTDLAPFLRALLSPAPPWPPSRAPDSAPIASSPAQPSTSAQSAQLMDAQPPSLSTPPDRWDIALVQFFQSAFENGEIKQFFVMSLTRDLADALPGVDIRHDLFCLQAVELLQQRGTCDHQFFEALRLIRAQRRPEIDAIQLACIGTLTPPPVSGEPPGQDPDPERDPDPEQDTASLPQFALVLDRTAQWLTLTNTLRDEAQHVMAMIHGDNHQDIGLFIRRTLRWANGTMNDRPPRSHELIAVQCYHEGHCPRSKDTWASRLLQAIAAKSGAARRSAEGSGKDLDHLVRIALRELARRSAALIVFIGQNNSGLRDGGDEGMKLRERGSFVDFLKTLGGALPGDAPHPLRFLIPIEHAPGAAATDELIDAVRATSLALRGLAYLPLQELDFPTWAEVCDSLRREGLRRNHDCNPRDLERLFRPTFEEHNALKSTQAHSFAALGKALSDILDRELPETSA